MLFKHFTTINIHLFYRTDADRKHNSRIVQLLDVPAHITLTLLLRH